jgi:hypothetical protein
MSNRSRVLRRSLLTTPSLSWLMLSARAIPPRGLGDFFEQSIPRSHASARRLAWASFDGRDVGASRPPRATPFELQTAAARTRIVPPRRRSGVDVRRAPIDQPHAWVNDCTWRRGSFRHWRKTARTNYSDLFVTPVAFMEVNTATTNPSEQQMLGRGSRLSN